MTPEDYHYHSEDAKIVGDKELSVYGVQLDSINVGKAEDSAIYIDYNQDKTHQYKPKDLQEGNVVKVGYQKRSVKTPYRIAYIQLHEVTQDKHKGDDWKQREFDLVLEPFNSRANTLALSGKRTFNSEKQFTEWTARRGIEDNSAVEVIEYITNSEYPVKRMMRRVGDRLNKFHDIQIISDVSLVELLDIKEPEVVPLII